MPSSLLGGILLALGKMKRFKIMELCSLKSPARKSVHIHQLK
jgi:hypothetical protein